MPGQGEPWEDLEFRELFGMFPLTGGPPSGDGLASLVRRLDRTPTAIKQQWVDGKTYCEGRSADVSAGPVQSYVDTHGLCIGAR